MYLKGIFYYDFKKNKYVIKIQDAVRHYLIKHPSYIDPDSVLRFLIIEGLIIYYDTRNKLEENIEYFSYQVKKTIIETLGYSFSPTEYHKYKLNKNDIDLTIKLLKKDITTKVLKKSELNEFLENLNLLYSLIKSKETISDLIDKFKNYIPKKIKYKEVLNQYQLNNKYPELYKTIRALGL